MALLKTLLLTIDTFHPIRNDDKKLHDHHGDESDRDHEYPPSGIEAVKEHHKRDKERKA
jgi:hypothetical protein